MKPYLATAISTIILALFISVYSLLFNLIPDVTYTPPPEIHSKLTSLKEVTIVNQRYKPNDPCIHSNVKIFSNHSSSSDNFTMWTCGDKIKHLTCPNLTITPQQDKAIISVRFTQKSEYALEDIIACANEAIAHAPTTPRYLDKASKNKASWKNTPH